MLSEKPADWLAGATGAPRPGSPLSRPGFEDHDCGSRYFGCENSLITDSSLPQPDSRRQFDLLLGPNMVPGSASTLVLEVGNMAAANLIARFDSKLDVQVSRFDAQGSRFDSKLDVQVSRFDAQGSRFESKLEAQSSKLEAQNPKIDALAVQFPSLRPMMLMGLGFTKLALLITLLRFPG